MAEQARALAALRDELEKQAQDAAARAMTEEQRRAAVEAQLADEKKLGDRARAQIALLNQNVDQLKAQLAAVAQALDLAQAPGRDKDVQIANLGQQLNAALAQKVRGAAAVSQRVLRQAAPGAGGPARHPDRRRPVRVPERGAVPGRQRRPDAGGRAQMTALAVTIKDIATEIPPDVHWMLRVDGHTDPQPVKGGPFALELGAVGRARDHRGEAADRRRRAARTVWPPPGSATTSRSIPADTPEAYAKNRRIELRLTDR